MKKVLIAFDRNHFSEGALEFVRNLNIKKPILLTGAFLPQVDYTNPGSSSVPPADEEAIKNNISRFESFCRTNTIKFRIHKDYFNFAIPELKKESRYADLLIICSEIFYEQAGLGEPNDYLKETLHGVECPTIVVPETFTFPESNILYYDGSHSSVNAIKQFSYLFPEFASHPTVLVYSKERNNEDFPAELNIKELTGLHFSQLTWFRLGAAPKEYFSNWLSQKKAAILVSGTFGHLGFSMLFKKSFITNVINNHQLPVFIAHK